MVKSSSLVVLEGNSSTAIVGGEIKKYKWRQISGKKVKVDKSEKHTLTFSAPEVETNTTLIFQLTTIEEGGHPNNFTSYDWITIIVEPSIGEDITPPDITLNSESNMTLHVGETYVEAGAAADDSIDGQVDVNITGTVDADTVGTYIITYTATDSAGNHASIARTVNVIELIDTNPHVVSISDDVTSLKGSYLRHNVNLSGVSTTPTVFHYEIKGITAVEGNSSKNGDDFIGTPLFTNPDIVVNKADSTITIPAGIRNFALYIETLKRDGEWYHVEETYSISLDGQSAIGTILFGEG